MIRSSVRVDGVNKALKVLKGMDPDIRKQFNRDAKVILRPVIDDAKSRYPASYLSGMGRSWQAGRIFPYSQARARAGVKVSVKQERNGTLLKITQADAAASVIEFAKNDPSGGTFSRNLTAASSGPSRVMWPAFDRHADQVADGVQELCDGVATRITAELKL
jgi:hypothetical protein